jgi:hypothetical protein
MKIVNFSADNRTSRIQKIPVDAGLGCPNRINGRTGCKFCSLHSFTPFYCNQGLDLTTQLETGINFFSKKYKCDGFLAYFQGTTNTFADISLLEKLFNQALEVKLIQGIVISTRPDCISTECLNFLKKLSKQCVLKLEIGIESCNDKILTEVNRGHNFSQTIQTISQLADLNIDVCGHIILGLPEESKESLISGAEKLSRIGLKSLKIHHFQVVKGSDYGDMFESQPEKFKLLSFTEYIILLAEFLACLSKDFQIERTISRVPPEYLLAPIWNGVTETRARKKLLEFMKDNNLFQGCRLKI